MPIWKDPTKDPPVDGESYLAKIEDKLDPIPGTYHAWPKRNKSKNPEYIGVLNTHYGQFQVWTNENNQVLQYKLLVPHL